MRATRSAPFKQQVSGAKHETAADQMAAALHASRLLSASSTRTGNVSRTDLLCLELEGHTATMLTQVLASRWNEKCKQNCV